MRALPLSTFSPSGTLTGRTGLEKVPKGDVRLRSLLPQLWILALCCVLHLLQSDFDFGSLLAPSFAPLPEMARNGGTHCTSERWARQGGCLPRMPRQRQEAHHGHRVTAKTWLGLAPVD